MGLFDKMKEPVFLKETSDAQSQIDRLKELEPLLNSEGQTRLNQDIKLLEYGIYGEKTIAFELKNSHMPIYVLHDVYLESDDLTAQIDYMVFTRKMCFVIECKNLFGDIEINSAGDFIRTIDFGGKKKKEGIYSPITQNQRHIELIKKIKRENANKLIKLLMTDKHFDDSYKSIVVLANPKTVLNAKFAKKDVKEKVIRADQLVKFIKECNSRSKEDESSDSRLLEWAQSFFNLHKNVQKDYTAKYQQFLLNPIAQEPRDDAANISSSPLNNEQPTYTSQAAKIEQTINIEQPIHTEKQTYNAQPTYTSQPIHTEHQSNPDIEVTLQSFTSTQSPIAVDENSEIFKELKAYRLTKSRAENIKPYFIYNDNQLKDLISKMPRSIDELIGVAGFNQMKAQKYGTDIINIVLKYI